MRKFRYKPVDRTFRMHDKELLSFVSTLDLNEILELPGAEQILLADYFDSTTKGPPKTDEEIEEFLDYIEDISEVSKLELLYPQIVNYYMTIQAKKMTYAPLRNPTVKFNPANVVKTKQDERDWEKAKQYYARNATASERHWDSADWATVMVIYKNIKNKRKRIRNPSLNNSLLLAENIIQEVSGTIVEVPNAQFIKIKNIPIANFIVLEDFLFRNGYKEVKPYGDAIHVFRTKNSQVSMFPQSQTMFYLNVVKING